MSDKDIVEVAHELLAELVPGNRLRERDLAPLLNRARPLLRALADEVQRLRKENASFIRQIQAADSDINERLTCDKCDLCEDHHA